MSVDSHFCQDNGEIVKPLLNPRPRTRPTLMKFGNDIVRRKGLLGLGGILWIRRLDECVGLALVEGRDRDWELGASC